MELPGFHNVSPIIRSGIYVLVAKGKVIYVGKAKAMLQRVYAHKHIYNTKRKGRKIPDWVPVTGIQFDEIHVRPCPLHELDALEAELINLYKPALNKQLKNQSKITTPFDLVINGKTVTVNAKPAEVPLVRRV